MTNKSMRAFYVKCALVVIAFGFFATQVAFMGRGEGYSMEPTLSNDSVVFGNKFDSTYKAGDIIVTYPLKSWSSEYGVIKRIVAGAGDVVVVDGINLYINGTLIDNSIMEPGYPHKEYTLAEDEFFLVGDNRSNSLDSRAKGPIKASDIEAKILFWLNF